jgi:hypothetical protein
MQVEQALLIKRLVGRPLLAIVREAEIGRPTRLPVSEPLSRY